MILLLERLERNPEETIGRLSIDGEFFCWTLEDVVRPDGVKVAGRTAIPKGVYRMDVTYSPRFKVMMPILLNVPMFEGIRIHWGNVAENTDGCILVGMDRNRGSIGRSRVAYDALMERLTAAKTDGQRLAIYVEDGE